MPLRVLALIAARSGSKGLAHKNIREVGGESLLARAVHLARAAARRGELWSVVVSTDSARYAALARRAGAETPWLRPAALARDRARLIDVVLHALAALEEAGRSFDVVVLLSATTPLTLPADVRRALDSWRAHRLSVISVVREQVPPSWRFRLQKGRLEASRGQRPGPRQSAPVTYVLNGAVYVAAPSWLRRHHQFFVQRKTRALVMPRQRSLDIEDAHDLAVARALLRNSPRGERHRSEDQDQGIASRAATRRPSRSWSAHHDLHTGGSRSE